MRSLAVLVPLFVLLPSMAAGQSASDAQPRSCAWESRPADEIVATALYERGRQLVADRAWGDAAAAIEASALLHPPCMKAITRLREAARLFHYAEELERARLGMIAAGERAVELQDYALAAHAYLDAADVAQLMGDPSAALLPLAAAAELARSPELSEPDRREIERRFRGGSASPAVEGAPTFSRGS